jgi:hypothetical protein
MKLTLRVTLVLGAALIGLLLAWSVLQAAPASGAAPALPVAPTPLPDRPAAQLPDISFIESPAASCILPVRGTDACYLTWSYMYADASPSFMITMTVEIDSRLRAQYHGFFQQWMYVPGEMMVFLVPCGEAGSGGTPGLGMSHSYALRARASDNLKSANYGTVFCPADEKEPFRVYLPFQARR